MPQLLDETRRTLMAGQENLRMVRASLQRMSRTTGELKVILGDLRELRRRAQATLARAKRQPGHGRAS